MMIRSFYPAAILLAFSLTACNGNSNAPFGVANDLIPTENGGGSNNNPNPSPTGEPRAYSTDVLLFQGDGTWSAEVASIKNILSSNGATYTAVNSAQMDAMSLDEMSKYGAIVFPGGSGGTQAGSLNSETKANLRAAVQERGVGYAGFCAGAFVSHAPKPAPGGNVSYGIGVAVGPVLDYYYLENQGVSTQMTMHTFADGSKADILWYGGPVTPNKGVIAKYPNGDPAISQVESGKGLVVISGGHPTATQSILSSLGLTSSDGTHTDVAWKMMQAAITHTGMPAFN